MRASEGFSQTSVTANVIGIVVKYGGLFAIDMVGTSGAFAFNTTGPDGTTQIPVKDINGNAVAAAALATPVRQIAWLDVGVYQFAATTVVGGAVSIQSIPTGG